MLSALPDLAEAEDPLNFLYPVEEPLALEDPEIQFPDELNGYDFVKLKPLKREEFMHTLIRALFAARGQIVMANFFAELIGRGGISFESLDNLITILEDENGGLSDTEMILFTDIYRRLKKSHSGLETITGKNVTNALIGFTSHSEEPRAEVLSNWRYEVEATVKGFGGMSSDFIERFNGISLAMILQLKKDGLAQHK